MKWGRIHEPLLLEEFRQEKGLPCVKPDPFWKLKGHPHIFANCDGIETNDNPTYVVEAKQSRFGDGFGVPGTDQIPEQYTIQVQHQMLCTGAELAYVVVLIGGNTCRTYEVPANKDIQENIVYALDDFWKNFVKKRILPDVDYKHPSAIDIVRKANPIVSGLEMKITDGDGTPFYDHPVYQAAQMYELMKLIESAAKDEKKSLQARVIALSGGAGLITFPDGTKITRKMQTRKGYIVKESTFEAMRFNWKGPEQDAHSRLGISPLKLGDGRPGEEDAAYGE